MIELDVAPRRTQIVAPADEPARYLVLGDFGGKRAEPLAVDRDNLNDILSILQVTAGGMRMRMLDDFHPDSLYQRLEMAAPAAVPEPEASTVSPAADIEKLIRPTSLLEQIAEGGDPFEQYVKDLARAHSAPQQKKNGDRTAALSERMNSLLHHPRFQALESAWRGLDFAVRQMDDAAARIYIVQCSKEELTEDLASDNLRATRLYAMLHSRKWTAAIGLHAFGEARYRTAGAHRAGRGDREGSLSRRSVRRDRGVAGAVRRDARVCVFRARAPSPAAAIAVRTAHQSHRFVHV